MLKTAIWGLLALAVAVGLGGILVSANPGRADLVIGNGAEPGSLDPAQARTLAEARVLGCLFEGLVVPDPSTCDPLPGMARTWESSEDGLTWTFHLRAGLAWSDGTPITAGDLRWSFLRFLHPRTSGDYVSELWMIRGARALTAGGAEVGGPARVLYPPDAGTWRCSGPHGDVAVEAQPNQDPDRRCGRDGCTWLLVQDEVRGTYVGGERSSGWQFLVEGRLVTAPAESHLMPVPEAIGIEAPDDRTLVLRLERPAPQLLKILSLFALYPVPRHAVLRHGRDWLKAGNLVSNGPFRMRFRRLRDRIRVERNPEYWDREHVSLETIDLLSAESESARLNLYLTGDADWITDVPSSAVPTLHRDYGPGGSGEFVPATSLGTQYYRINTTKPPFDDVRIRRALSLAIDRQAIVQNLTRAGEPPAWSLVPPGTAGGLPARAVRHSPEEARRMLHQALRDRGLERLPTFELAVNASGLYRSIAEVVQEQWRRELGVECRIQTMDSRSLKQLTGNLEYDLARASWVGDYDDPATFLDLYLSDGSNNQTGFADPEYDRLVRELAPRERDVRERAMILQRAEQILLESAAIIPLYHLVSRNLVKPYVTGFHQNLQDIHPPKFLGIRESR